MMAKPGMHFVERVTACRVKLDAADRDENIVVFTSATPIGIWAALAMEIQDERALRLAGVLHNASCTVMRLTTASCGCILSTRFRTCGSGLRTYR